MNPLPLLHADRGLPPLAPVRVTALTPVGPFKHTFPAPAKRLEIALWVVGLCHSYALERADIRLVIEHADGSVVLR